MKLIKVINQKWLSRFVLLGISAFFISSHQVNAQIKIYVDTDLEGASGVYKFAQTREKDTPLNIQACEYFMGDLAAVVKGLRDGGATEIIVNDGHGSGAVIPHLMEPGAVYLTGKPRSGFQILDKSFSGMVLIDFHAMNGTTDGVLHHTQSSKTEHKYWYNGVEFGEIGQMAALAGYYGIPPLMVSGDEATCREAKKFFGPECVTVATKKGVAREAAILYPFSETRKALYEGAKKAVAAIPKCKPFTIQLPIKGKMQYNDPNSTPNDPKVIVKEKTFNSVQEILNFSNP
jgi:D-amino peptidase